MARPKAPSQAPTCRRNVAKAMRGSCGCSNGGGLTPPTASIFSAVGVGPTRVWRFGGITGVYSPKSAGGCRCPYATTAAPARAHRCRTGSAARRRLSAIKAHGPYATRPTYQAARKGVSVHRRARSITKTVIREAVQGTLAAHAGPALPNGRVGLRPHPAQARPARMRGF